MTGICVEALAVRFATSNGSVSFQEALVLQPRRKFLISRCTSVVALKNVFCCFFKSFCVTTPDSLLAL